MFTGLIAELGTVSAVEENPSGRLLRFQAPKLASQLRVDDSVALNGVCQTVINCQGESVTVQVIHTTLEKTSLGQLKVGDPLNLELAMCLGERLGGHLVSGHVSGPATIESIVARGENREVWLRLPAQEQRYIVKEGSIALDGISLTVADCQDDRLMVSLIPHTWKMTNFSHKKVGDVMNLEVDLLAKHVEKLLLAHTPSSQEKSV